MVRLTWRDRRGGRHHKRGRFAEELRRARDEHAGLQLQVDDLRDAVTALQPPAPRADDAPQVDPRLAAAMASARRDGTGLPLDVGGEEVIVVVGDESRDPAPVWDFLNRQLAS